MVSEKRKNEIAFGMVEKLKSEIEDVLVMDVDSIMESDFKRKVVLRIEQICKIWRLEVNGY